MPPKFGYDADGDVPPCGIMWDITMLEKWEEYKNKKHGNKRKQSCMCCAFEGKIPDTHKCFKPTNKVGCFSWLRLFIKRNN
jgi:hypothetical protein